MSRNSQSGWRCAPLIIGGALITLLPLILFFASVNRQSSENGSRGLLESWFSQGRALLPVIRQSAQAWDGAGVSLQSLLAGSASPDGSAAGETLAPPQREAIAAGDIIMRQGAGPVSRVIVEFFASGAESTSRSESDADGHLESSSESALMQPDARGVSHVGIVVPPADGEGEWDVVHSLPAVTDGGPGGVRREALSDFLADTVGGTTVVTRPRLSHAERLRMAFDAQEYYQQRYPFDLSFSLDDESALYCSELVYRVLPSHVRRTVTVLSSPGAIVSFDSFVHPEWFEIVLDFRE